MGKRGRRGYGRVSSREVNKRFVYYVTIVDDTGRYSRLVYRTLRSIVKKYDSQYWGRYGDRNDGVHLHALVVTRTPIDYEYVQSKLRTKGIYVHFDFINGRTVNDLKRIVKYVDEKNGGREIGSRYAIRIARRILDPYWNS